MHVNCHALLATEKPLAAETAGAIGHDWDSSVR